MPMNQMSFQVEEPRRPAPPRGAMPVEKWKAASGGIGLLIIIIIVILLVLAPKDGNGAGPGDGGGGGTGGGDDVIVDPVGPPAERIIWVYHDGELSPYQQLCKETVEFHRGDFEFKLVSEVNVSQQLSAEDLPTYWNTLKPRYKRDAAINALLARHGGVALDINTILFRSFDTWWGQDMEERGVAFKGFYYKSRAETATWFMMVGDRGTAMMQKAVERQNNLSGNDPAGCTENEKNDGVCYGSSVVSYALCTYRSEYCKCYKDENNGCELLAIESRETDAQYDLTDPRRTVQSELHPDKLPKEEKWQPMASTDAEGEEGEEEEEEEEFANFKMRFNKDLHFISLQAPTSKTDEMAGKSRDELLSDQGTFFYQWLCLAKHPDTEEDACG